MRLTTMTQDNYTIAKRYQCVYHGFQQSINHTRMYTKVVPTWSHGFVYESADIAKYLNIYNLPCFGISLLLIIYE